MADYIDDYYANGGSGEFDSTKIDFVDNFYANGGAAAFDWSHPNTSLSDDDADNAKDLSKKNFGKTLGKIADGILKYGNGFASLLTRIGVITDPTLKISANNVDLSKAKLALAALAVREKEVIAALPKDPPPPNSTYFGIDFSKPVTWVVVGILLVVAYKLFTLTPQVVAMPKK